MVSTILPQEWSISNFPRSLTRNIPSHSMKNLAFHSLLRLRWLYYEKVIRLWLVSSMQKDSRRYKICLFVFKMLLKSAACKSCNLYWIDLTCCHPWAGMWSKASRARLDHVSLLVSIPIAHTYRTVLHMALSFTPNIEASCLLLFIWVVGLVGEFGLCDFDDNVVISCSKHHKQSFLCMVQWLLLSCMAYVFKRWTHICLMCIYFIWFYFLQLMMSMVGGSPKKMTLMIPWHNQTFVKVMKNHCRWCIQCLRSRCVLKV